MKFLVNRQDLGNRIMGYIVYDSISKEFNGYTEKQIASMLKGEIPVMGFVLSEDDTLQLDGEGFKTKNYMVRTGINGIKPMSENDALSTMFYVVVGTAVENGKSVYEVVNSKYARYTINESKLKSLLEFGAVQGGAYLDEKGKLSICPTSQTA